MTEIIVNWLKNLIDNEYLLLYVLSIIPLTEMRGAIVLSGGMDINHIIAYWACVGGASTVVLPLMLLFRPLMKWLKRTRLFKPLADMLENAVREKADVLEAQNKKFGNGIYWALFIFVAIPLPLTGVWTGTAIAAFVGLKFWKSVLAISAGNLTAALVLMLLVYFAKDYIDIILIVFISILVLSTLIIAGRKWQKKHLAKEKIDNAEEQVPQDEKPFVGEFAAGGEGEKELVVEVLDENGEPIVATDETTPIDRAKAAMEKIGEKLKIPNKN